MHSINRQQIEANVQLCALAQLSRENSPNRRLDESEGQITALAGIESTTV